MDDKLEKIVKKHISTKNSVEILQDIQKEFGYLSEENLKDAAKALDIPLAKLYGVATFYALFKLSPEGKYRISVCRGTACHVKGSKNLMEYIEKKINIKAGETTNDTMFSLQRVNCLGACAKAPAMMINDVVYGDLTEQKIDKILAGLN
ncbi:MAG: NADH-quinone oxidoreductase subunit NuoE [archaeon]